MKLAKCLLTNGHCSGFSLWPIVFVTPVSFKSSNLIWCATHLESCAFIIAELEKDIKLL